MGARRALITGITGQDGSYLAELLLQKGYEVTGTMRHEPARHLGHAEHLRSRLSLLAVDLHAPQRLYEVVSEVQPEELYHLASPSFVPDSWKRPTQTLAAIAGSTATLLEAVRACSPETRVFHAASGAIFGAAPESPQHEETPCSPLTPYATAKLAAHQLVGELRGHDGLFACSGILYNHESVRRPEHFLPRKVTRAAAAIKLGLASEVVLGDLNAIRDWSFAGDIVHGAWLMLQANEADDYILASGRGHTVAELADIAFSHAGLEAQRYIRVDPTLVRTSEGTPQVGDPTRARRRLGWSETVSFEQLITGMVDHDLAALRSP